MNRTSWKNAGLRLLLMILLTVLYLKPWHQLRYYFAKEWLLPEVGHLKTEHYQRLVLGGFGTGVGFKLSSFPAGEKMTWRYKTAGGWFLLIPLIFGIIMGFGWRFAVTLFLFHIMMSLLNAALFYLGAGWSDFSLALADLSCCYLVPALSLAAVPFRMAVLNRGFGGLWGYTD